MFTLGPYITFPERSKNPRCDTSKYNFNLLAKVLNVRVPSTIYNYALAFLCFTDVPRIKTNIIAEYTESVYTLCGLRCAANRFCAAINFKEKVVGKEHNCQLTNTIQPKFADENSSEKKKVWTFRRVNVDRSMMVSL